MTEDAYQVDRKQLAAILGVGRGRLDGYVAAGMPVVQAGSKGVPWIFDLRAAVRWWGQHREEQGGVEHVDAARERALRDRAERELKELDLATRRGEILDRATVTAGWMEILVRVRDRVLAIPAQCAIAVSAESDPKKVRVAIEEECRAALSELAAAEDF